MAPSQVGGIARLRCRSMEDLDALVRTFRKWLHLPDADALLVVLAAIVTNHIEGDPLWLMLVGPSGGGKTEFLSPLTALANVLQTSTLTEAALLSGTAKKEVVPGATGGLLREIGEFGIIVCKDFTSILSMNRDTRGAVLSALREVYDGSWTRRLGVDGGTTLSWKGKVGLIAACTAAIDRHHAVIGAMGERFVMYRLPET